MVGKYAFVVASLALVFSSPMMASPQGEAEPPLEGGPMEASSETSPSTQPPMTETQTDPTRITAPPPAQPTIGLVVHVPVAEAPPDRDVIIEVTLSDVSQMAQVEVFYRSVGKVKYDSLSFERGDNGRFVAIIPHMVVREPGVQYYIASGTDAFKEARFASETNPQLIHVRGESLEARMERELQRYDGKRSRARVGFDWVDFGAQQENPDRFYTIRADFTYRPLRTIRSLRFGVERMRAETFYIEPGIEGGNEDGSDIDPSYTPLEPGIDFGFGEIEFGLTELFGIRVQARLGANEDSFTAGGEVGVRIGLEPGTHVAIDFGGIAGVGMKVGLGLHWDTVPKVPMSAGMEITNWPMQGEWGLGLLYSAQVPLPGGFCADLNARYQSRSSLYGGFGGGIGLVYAF